MCFVGLFDDLKQTVRHCCVGFFSEFFDVVIRLRLPAVDFVEFQEDAGVSARIAERVFLVAFLVLVQRRLLLDDGEWNEVRHFEQAHFVLLLLHSFVEVAVDDVRAGFRFLVGCSNVEIGKLYIDPYSYNLHMLYSQNDGFLTSKCVKSKKKTSSIRPK